jgi:hypothetical protein
MMTTPGNFAIYQEQGIQAVSLYYSATPFDAFRVFSRPLNRTEAYNPVTYKNPHTNEKMTIIPTYHIGDLMENISLRHWIENLHDLQKNGRVDHDVLIYINYDADSEFWSGLNLSWPLNQLPNTGGLAALIDEVKNIEYLRFTTLNAYLKDHPPVGTFFFGQDTADGSFDGYNSWAEKSQAHEYWTRIEHHRRIDQMAKKTLAWMDDAALNEKVLPLLDAVYLKRMRALSTTNFGMATPFLAPDRDKSVSILLDEMDQYAHHIEMLIRSGVRNRFQSSLTPGALANRYQWIDTLMVMGLNQMASESNGRFLNVNVTDKNRLCGAMVLMKPDGRSYPAKIIHARPSNTGAGTNLKLYIPKGKELDDGYYYLLHHFEEPAAEKSNPHATRHLDNGHVALRFGSDGKPSGLFINGIQKLKPGSLTPYFRHNNKIEQPARLNVMPLKTRQGVQSVQVRGPWKGPDHSTLKAGEVDYHFSLVDGLPYLFIDGRVKMPLTEEKDIFKGDTPALAHRADLGWQEVAPMELRFAHRATIDDPIRILKQNFLNVASSYTIDYFKHSADNLSLDNINNHITAAYVGMVAGGRGMAVGMDTHLQANFAFAPIKVRYGDDPSAFSAKVNPFGTYHGKQYRHPTWGNRQGYELTVMAGEQFHSAGPTYNGQSTAFATMLAFFDGDDIDTRIKSDLIHFARPPMVLSLIHTKDNDPVRKQLSPPKKVEAFYVENGVYLRWDSMNPNVKRYRIHIGGTSKTYNQIIDVSKNGLVTQHFMRHQTFEKNKTYYAAVEAISADGGESEISPEIPLKITSDRRLARARRLSLNFQIKVVWANIHAYFKRYVT